MNPDRSSWSGTKRARSSINSPAIESRRHAAPSKMTLFAPLYHYLTHGRLAFLVRLVPVAILGCAGVGGPSALLLISKFWLTSVNGLRLPRFPLWPSSCGQSTLASQRDASVTSSRANEQAPLSAAVDDRGHERRLLHRPREERTAAPRRACGVSYRHPTAFLSAGVAVTAASATTQKIARRQLRGWNSGTRNRHWLWSPHIAALG